MAARWAWHEGRNRWQTYDASVSNSLEAAFLRPDQRSFSLIVGHGTSATHTIDLDHMIQVNLSTNFEREVRRQLPPGEQVAEIWSFEDEHDSYIEDHPAISAMCSVARTAGRRGVTKYSFHSGCLWAYSVDFATMTQVNRRTGKQRRVRCTPSTAGMMPNLGGLAISAPQLPLLDKFEAVSPASIDLSVLTKWSVLAPGSWDAEEDDPIMCTPLGEGGEQVVRLPCHTDALHCTFNRSTLVEAFKSSNKCPCCGTMYAMPGPQPSGTLRAALDAKTDCDGHPGCGTIMVEYRFPDGTQLPQHPAPGQPYGGTRRVAYLPCDDVGVKCLHLLRAAFLQGQLFRVGSSVTTGRENTVVWSIHQKTNTSGGPTRHGWPDPEYLSRLKSECAAANVHGALDP